jgi:hypothetical protein
MKSVLLLVACSLALGACGHAGSSTAGGPEAASVAPVPSSATAAMAVPTASNAPVDSPAHYDGYGAMRFGMDKDEFHRAWGGDLADTSPAPGSSCFYRRPVWVKVPADFAFMFEDGRFVRYEVGTAKDTAPGGGKVGMPEARIRALYGSRIDAQSHKYVAGAKYLRVNGEQGQGVLVFETDATGKVTRWRVGVPPQVDYVEGCG